MAFKEMEQPAAIETTKQTQQLTADMLRIQQDRRLSGESKAQQSLDAVKGFVVRNPAELTQQMAKGLAATLESQVAYLEANRAKYSRDAIASPVIAGSTARQLGADAEVISANSVKVSDNFQKVLEATRTAATYAGTLANRSDEQLGGKKGEYIEKLYTNLTAIVDLSLENRASYNEMALAAGRSNQRAEQEFKTGAAVTAGIALTVVGMGAGGVLAHAVGHAVAHAGAGTLATAGATVGTSAAAGAVAGIAADAAMIGIKEERLITLGEMGSVAWKGAALGALAHIPITQLAELAHAGRTAKVAVEATGVSAVGAAVTLGGRVAMAEEGAVAVKEITVLARNVESGAVAMGKGTKLAKTAVHGMTEEEMEESHEKAREVAKKGVEDKFGD